MNKPGDNTLYPRFSDVEYSRRYTATRAAMREHDCASLLVYASTSAYHEVLYLSNFITSREVFLVFPAEGEPTLFVQYYNHLPNARQLSCVADVHWGGLESVVTVANHLREKRLDTERIGVVGPMPFKQYASLQQLLPQATFVDFSSQMMQLRLVKSEEEIEFLRQGAAFSDLAMEALAQQARPGITEHALTAIVEGAYLSLGGRTHIHYMATTPMSNPSVCVPAQQQSRRVLQAGDVLITEISAHYHGYAGQILRPFAIGAPPTPQYQRMYDVAVEAFERIAAAIRPGATTAEVLDAAEYIHTSGFTICDDLVHGFGGGYLPPVLRTRQTSPRLPAPFTFRENMLIVMQPNVITADERMGVQVGELVQVKANGIESLHRYPMRFTQCQ